MPTPNVPDHENPAWLREIAPQVVQGVFYRAEEEQITAALSRLADIIDVCERGGVSISASSWPCKDEQKWCITSGVGSHRGPTLLAAVRAFLAAERQDNTPPSPDTIP